VSFSFIGRGYKDIWGKVLTCRRHLKTYSGDSHWLHG